MTYQEFKDKYNGKYIDYDGQYGGQCWDLAEAYAVECLGIPEYVLAGCGNVKNLLKEPKINDMREYFDETDEYNLYTGDIVIFEYGHICIFDHWDGEHCWYFSQNPNPCQVMQINRGGVHGFRLKPQYNNNNNSEDNSDNANNDNNDNNITEEYDVVGKATIDENNNITLNLKINK